MKARLLAESPGEIVFTVKLTASAKEWEALRDQLQTAWPSSELSRAITNLLGQARRVFYPEGEE